MRTMMRAMVAVVAVGCCEPDECPVHEPPPWNGTEVVVNCGVLGVGGPEYSYVCPGPYGGTCYAHATDYDWQSCLQVSEPYPWTVDYDAWSLDLVAECQALCQEKIEAQADEANVNLLSTDCGGYYYFVDNGWVDQHEPSAAHVNCPTAASFEEPDEPVVITWTPAGGPATRASGQVSYTLGRPDSTGSRNLRVNTLAFDAPITLTTSSRNATALLGYPSGTVIRIGDVEVAPIDLRVNRSGVGTFAAGSLWFSAWATITVPGTAARTLRLSAYNPWSVTVTATEADLSMSMLTDPFGGTLVAN